jgi:multidrug resistance efflux pump
MINRIFGWLFTLAALAVVAFAVLNRGNYTSMCFNDEAEVDTKSVSVAPEVNEIEEPVVELPDTAAEVDAPAIDVDTAIVQ